MWTASEGHIEIAKLLLERGAVIKTHDKVHV